MTPDHISKRIVVDRLDLIDTLLREIRALPLGDHPTFSLIEETFGRQNHVCAGASKRSLVGKCPVPPKRDRRGKGHNQNDISLPGSPGL